MRLLTYILFLLGVVPLNALAQTSVQPVARVTTNLTFAGFVRTIVDLINLVLPVLAGAAILFFFVGLVRFIYKAGDAKGRAKGRDAIVWGLIGIFVIFSLWGIITLAQQSLLGTTTQQPGGSSQNLNQNGSNPYQNSGNAYTGPVNSVYSNNPTYSPTP